MNIPEILDFLKRLSENNTREWFQEHKNEYQNAQSSFENLLADIIARISLFDEVYLMFVLMIVHIVFIGMSAFGRQISL